MDTEQTESSYISILENPEGIYDVRGLVDLERQPDLVHYLQQLGAPLVKIIMDDTSLSEDQKEAKLRFLKGSFEHGVQRSVQESHTSPREVADEFRGYGDKEDPKEVEKRLEGYLTGLAAGAFAQEHSVKGVYTLIEMGKTKGQFPSEALGTQVDFLTEYRHRFDGQNLDKRKDPQVLDYLDRTIKENSGIIYNLSNMHYNPPVSTS